ncbi:MAG TPA: pilus assembly protein TadG-related protein [Gemmatimonadota bacterium]|nr:pilus assembly protein TadG-related protein [Gemmatimonadota bacterium]
MTLRFRDERGAVLVMAAVMIPVFLLLTALVVDVGNWFTHKRQLQNRADAAAFAAGIEYAESWKQCVQSGDLTLKANTARMIANAARQFAADPEATDYAPDPLPSVLWNSEIANQANLDVMINSIDYTDDNDYTDGGTGNVANPCFPHPADDISAAGHWTDVKVKERDLPSLFGSVGLPLARNGARARIEIRPAISGHRFLPLAVPNNNITKVQVRYYDECRNQLIPGSTQELAPLADPDQAGFAAAGGGTLWGIKIPGSDPPEGDSSRSFDLVLPSYGGCGQDYLPIGVEVRLASRDEIDINAPCDALALSKFADCFRRLSQIRVWNDGDADTEPRVRDVFLTGGCPSADAYFGPLPVAATECRFGANVDVEWGTRDNDELAESDNFSVRVNGVDLDPPGPTTPSGLWSTASNTIIANPGANTVSVEVDWEDTNTAHTWEQGGGQCKNGNNPCKWNGPAAPAHRAFVGTNTNAGAVTFIRSSREQFVPGPGPGMEPVPGSAFDNIADGGVTVPVFPTIGTRSVLKTGVLTTLRLDDPQANQTLYCDPNFAQGQEFSTFRWGCQPWYAANEWGGDWWNTGTKTCPQRDQFFSYATMPLFGENGMNNAWQCVPTAPGLSTPMVGEGLSVATDNCSNINNNQCQTTSCLVDGNYDGKPGSTDPGWKNRLNGLGSRDPRVVNLFIIPYQSLKGSSGGDPQETAPILGFASFYVMNWTGSNSQNSDPCPDPTFGSINVPNPPSGAATGVFIETVDYETGPVDPLATCVEGQLTPCRAVLVR